MDTHSFYWSNQLLGNDVNASQIEVTMGPFRACFKKATNFSLCGGRFKWVNDSMLVIITC